MATAFKCDHCGLLHEGQALHYGEVEAHGFVFALLPSRRVQPKSQAMTPQSITAMIFHGANPTRTEEPLDLCEPCLRDLGEAAAEKLTAGEYTKLAPTVDDPLAGAAVELEELS